MLDIKQDGIDIQEIMQRYGLHKDYKLGQKIHNMLQAYKGKGTYLITEEDKRRIEQLGFGKEKETSIGEALRILGIIGNYKNRGHGS